MSEPTPAPLWALNDDDDITYRDAPVFKVYREHDFPCLEDEDRPAMDAEAIAHAHAVVALLNGPTPICGAWWRLGAIAMRDATQAHVAANFPVVAQMVADVALPAVPERPVRPDATGWYWYAGTSAEWYQCGPHTSRDEALADARATFPAGVDIHLIEGRRGAIKFDAVQVIERFIEYDAGDLFDGEHRDPDRVGNAYDVDAADQELQELLDGWLDRWRGTFTTPNLFADARNEEVVSAEALAA